MAYRHTHGREFFEKLERDGLSLVELAKHKQAKGEYTLDYNGIKLKFDQASLNNIKPMTPPSQKEPSLPPLLRQLPNGLSVKPAEFEGKRVLIVEKDGFKCIVIDENRDKAALPIWLLFGVIVLGISALYWFIIKSLKPIDTLKNTIEKFGSGNLQISSNIATNDEIGQIAKAFDDSAKQIRILIESKDIFLKNAAHELRTPITKGIITTHLLQDSRDKEILLSVFKRLETLSESVLSLEQFLEKDFSLNLEPTIPKELAIEAMELLFLESLSVELIDLEKPILADSKLMLIVFKNLIDNGVKFADDNKVIIAVESGIITFKNLGQKLEEPIERYFDPFFKETSIRNTRGTGLGLFLAKKIANAHGINLRYKHKDGYNYFCLG